MCKCLFFESASKNMLSISRHSYIGPLSMIHMQFQPNDLSFGSFEFIWGQIPFLPLTFDRIEIERWEWPNLYLSQRRIDWYEIWPAWLYTWSHVTLTLVQILKLTFLGQHVHSYFDGCCQNFVSSFLSSKVICEKPCLQKALFWLFLISLA